ncbi:hypothetical protein AZE42_03696 [Rhizopogon vesiculosus]|uniref:Uncharacterized protein n=1 Tax=Rhizopogon vesiculosus TaxID=180088 RepID=A0A1J8QN22_9AGAM|nr:hypothetical protein AZE42_03696 [Rhizopogon vesiculosus]
MQEKLMSRRKVDSSGPLWGIYDHASASEKHLLYNFDWPERECGAPHVEYGKCSEPSFSKR